MTATEVLNLQRAAKERLGSGVRCIEMANEEAPPA
jgi:hypothetical protein